MRKHIRLSKRIILWHCLTAFLIFVVWLYSRHWFKGNRPLRTSNIRYRRSDLLDTIQTFGGIIKGNVKICLIEPSILFGIISYEEQLLLKSKGFHLNNLRGLNNVLSFAVFSEEVAKLKDIVLRSKLSSAGFKHFEVKSAIKIWTNNTPEVVPTHHFYIRREFLVHVIVFYKRGNYLWHGKLARVPKEVQQVVTYKKLLFAKADSSYQRFGLDTFPWNQTFSSVYVPADIAQFLFEIETSTFISCNGSIDWRSSWNATDPKQVPYSVFATTAILVMTKLRALLTPTLSQFWLASGTLLGWYRDCGLIPYTSDIDFSSWADDIDQNLIQTFKSNADLKFIASLGQIEEDLEFWLRYQWLRVDLFFTYTDRKTNTCYVGGHRPELGYSFRYIFPEFSLCSGDLLGHKVLVPCNPEAVIEAEYGPEWKTPVENWNYEISARNVLGRRYWDEKEKASFLNSR